MWARGKIRYLLFGGVGLIAGLGLSFASRALGST
jgi:hypothetical protein